MRTFAAAAIAASASAFDAVSIPEFIAGFMFGMTGDNNLTEVEACYQGAQSLEPFIQKMIADVKQFKMLKAVWQLQLFILNI